MEGPTRAMTIAAAVAADARSFIDVAPESHFPIQNLPLAVFDPGDGLGPRVGVAIGAHVLDLSVLEHRRLLEAGAADGARVFDRPTLNAFMALGRPAWSAVRARLGRLLAADEPTLRDDATLLGQSVHAMERVTLRLPAEIGDYTDFYASREHATNVGTMFRGPDNALMPNWLHLPVAYHGRASSIVVSGTDVRRPLGQTMPPGAATPVFGPSLQMDFELEMGCFMGPGNALGQPVPVADARDRVFGLVLVNDWSARDIQAWEYVPLGPFLAKNLGTSISPWVVSLDALAPFRVPGPVQDPPPLPYLRSTGERTFDIQLEVWLQGERMARAERIAASNYRHLHWDVAQQVAHHTVNGCNLRPGDLLASGTISGPEAGARGSLLELSWRGRDPLRLAEGETRTFLEDGDRVTMIGWCQGNGYRVGFGEVTGRLLPARADASA